MEIYFKELKLLGHTEIVQILCPKEVPILRWFIYMLSYTLIVAS